MSAKETSSKASTCYFIPACRHHRWWHTNSKPRMRALKQRLYDTTQQAPTLPNALRKDGSGTRAALQAALHRANLLGRTMHNRAFDFESPRLSCNNIDGIMDRYIVQDRKIRETVQHSRAPSKDAVSPKWLKMSPHLDCEQPFSKIEHIHCQYLQKTIESQSLCSKAKVGTTWSKHQQKCNASLQFKLRQSPWYHQRDF